MNAECVKATLAEARRFVRAAETAIEADKANREAGGYSLFLGSRETGALRRASMDLTRALATMRRA